MPTIEIKRYLQALEEVLESTADADAPIMTIGEASHRTGVTPRAIRFYETSGIVSPHRSGRFRLYSRRDVQKLAITKLLRSMNADIETISDLIQQISKSHSTLESRELVRAAVADQLATLEQETENALRLLKEARELMVELEDQNKRDN